MKSLQTIFQWIYDNWATLVAIITLAYGIYKKAVKTYSEWKTKTEEERLEIAKASLKQCIIAIVKKAEEKWTEKGSGEFKKADVLAEIYAKYPILEQYISKTDVYNYVDKLIEDAVEAINNKCK